MNRLYKMLISLLFIFTLTSCTTTFIGNITAYNSDGTILKKWNGITIKEVRYGTLKQNALKRDGIEFYDNKSRKYIYITKSVPCIIEYHTDTLCNKDNIYDNRYVNRYDRFEHSVNYY